MTIADARRDAQTASDHRTAATKGLSVLRLHHVRRAGKREAESEGVEEHRKK